MISKNALNTIFGDLFAWFFGLLIIFLCLEWWHAGFVIGYLNLNFWFFGTIICGGIYLATKGNS